MVCRVYRNGLFFQAPDTFTSGKLHSMEPIGTTPMINIEKWMGYTAQYLFGECASCSRKLKDLHVSRPAANRESPFSMISSDPAEIEAMKTAASNPQLVVLSDWDHLTSDAYMQAMRESGYDIL